MMLQRIGLTLALTLAFGVITTSPPAAAHEDHEKAARAAAMAPQQAAPIAASVDHGAMTMTTVTTPAPMPKRLYSWLGRWHPAAVHFPIALFLVVGLLEISASMLRWPWLARGASVLIPLAALSAVAAAGLGWLAMGLPGPAEDLTHAAHRWLGSSLAGIGLLTWWAKHRSEQPTSGPAARLLYAGLLTVVVAVVLFNAYLGGALTHGADHLRF